MDKDGNYLGRSTQLPSLMPRLGGINGKSQGSISLRDSGDSIVLDAWTQSSCLASHMVYLVKFAK